MLANVVEIITTVLTFAGLAYYLLALWSARAFLREAQKASGDFHPPVSILKPLKGLDAEMYESFVSHCRQNYSGDYEILFGVSSLDDSAVSAVQRLQAEFPERRIQLILCPEILGTNGKVSNLTQMLPQVQYDYILINDSDIKVSPNYLSRVLAPFAANVKQKQVGMATAPYRGRAHKTIGSKMEALGIATDFIAGVFVARKLDGGIRFGLGSTLAVSRVALEAAGGLTPLVDYLADDYQLGARIAAAGYEVVLVPEVVETSVPAYRFSQYLAHQLRWAHGVRDSRKLGYLGLAISYGLAWACINLIASGFDLSAIALFSLTFLARIALALSVGVGILGDRQVMRDLWLLLPRDIIALGIWAWSYAGNSITWRNQTFTLKDGKLIKP